MTATYKRLVSYFIVSERSRDWRRRFGGRVRLLMFADWPEVRMEHTSVTTCSGAVDFDNLAGVGLVGMRDWERQDQYRIGWLAPIEIDERGPGLDLDPVGRRPSRKGFWPISLLKYLEIVEWAGRQQRLDKPGSRPSSLSPFFERVGFRSTGFLESLLRFAEQEKFFEATERLGKPERHFAQTHLLASSRG